MSRPRLVRSMPPFRGWVLILAALLAGCDGGPGAVRVRDAATARRIEGATDARDPERSDGGQGAPTRRRLASAIGTPNRGADRIDLLADPLARA